jgi:DNA-binding CsgD family transcriptional regulator
MGFTPRQAQILELAARGRSDKQIAGDLGVSVHTVRSHLRRLYETLGLANRAEAVAAFMTERADADGPEPAHEPQPDRRPQPRALVAGLVAGVTLALAAAAAWSMAPTRFTTLPAAAPAGARHESAAPPAPHSPTPGSPAPPAAAGVTPAPSASPSAGAAAPPLPAPAPAPTAPIQMIAATGQLSLINQERATAGLPPLAWNDCLAGVASAEARRMAQQGYVSSAGGLTADGSCRLGTVPAAEELAYWPGASDSQINAVLIANPADKAKLLGPYRYLGAYWAIGPTGVAFVALELA